MFKNFLNSIAQVSYWYDTGTILVSYLCDAVYKKGIDKFMLFNMRGGTVVNYFV